MVYVVLCSVYGVWYGGACMVCGVCCVVQCVWCSVYGVWYGAACMVCGAYDVWCVLYVLYSVYGVWCV